MGSSQVEINETKLIDTQTPVQLNIIENNSKVCLICLGGHPVFPSTKTKTKKQTNKQEKKIKKKNLWVVCWPFIY